MQAQIIDILLKSKPNKGHIFNELVENYPAVFLALYNLDYDTFVPESDIADRIEDAVDSYAASHQYDNALIGDLRARIRELEESTAASSDELPPIPHSLRDLCAEGHYALFHVREGRKIEAIKYIRETYKGTGLKQAKDWVDELQARFSPETVKYHY